MGILKTLGDAFFDRDKKSDETIYDFGYNDCFYYDKSIGRALSDGLRHRSSECGRAMNARKKKQS